MKLWPFSLPIPIAVHLFDKEPCSTSYDQGNECSKYKIPQRFSTTVQLLEIHSKYGCREVERHINESEDCDCYMLERC